MIDTSKLDAAALVFADVMLDWMADQLPKTLPAEPTGEQFAAAMQHLVSIANSATQTMVQADRFQTRLAGFIETAVSRYPHLKTAAGGT